MTGDLLALVLANAALVAAGHGVLRLAGIRPALSDLAWSVALAYLAGAATIGVLGSAALVLGLALTWWQILLVCTGVFAVGSVRRGHAWSPERVRVRGRVRLLPAATLAVLALLAVDLAVQPIWTDDAWSIWAAKANSIVLCDGLDPDFLASASAVSPNYPARRSGARGRCTALLPASRTR